MKRYPSSVGRSHHLVVFSFSLFNFGTYVTFTGKTWDIQSHTSPLHQNTVSAYGPGNCPRLPIGYWVSHVVLPCLVTSFLKPEKPSRLFVEHPLLTANLHWYSETVKREIWIFLSPAALLTLSPKNQRRSGCRSWCNPSLVSSDLTTNTKLFCPSDCVLPWASVCTTTWPRLTF